MSVNLISWHIIYFIAYIERGKRQASARCLTTEIRLLRTRRGSPGRALSTWLGKRRRVDQDSPRLQVELRLNGVSFQRVLVSSTSVQITHMCLKQSYRGAFIHANFHTCFHMLYYTQYLFDDVLHNFSYGPW